MVHGETNEAVGKTKSHYQKEIHKEAWLSVVAKEFEDAGPAPHYSHYGTKRPSGQASLKAAMKKTIKL